MDTIVKCPNDVDGINELRRGFENRGFPQRVETIDGTHIPHIIAHKKQPDNYFNKTLVFYKCSSYL